jgi:hypothetical protein
VFLFGPPLDQRRYRVTAMPRHTPRLYAVTHRHNALNTGFRLDWVTLQSPASLMMVGRVLFSTDGVTKAYGILFVVVESCCNHS